MKRRDFFAASAAAGIAAGSLGKVTFGQDDLGEKQVIELRTYTCADADQKAALLKMLEAAAVPAWNRLGIKPVGVLVEDAELNEGGKNLDPELLARQVFVLMPHPSPTSVATANRAMLDDATYMAALEELAPAPPAALYDSYESAVFIGFDECPTVEVPTTADTRVLQLRIYEACNEERGAKKVKMFNEGGELATFRETGMNPVFFGERITGGLMPNLTYMLGFDDMDAKNEAWAAFMAHPHWQKIKSDPEYANTVSRITNIMLRPAGGSQL